MRRVLAGLAALLLVGCMPKVEQPEVWLAGAEVASIGFRGGVVDVSLSVYYPNNFDLRASGLTYDVDFETTDGEGWIDFTEGRIERDVRVASGDTAVVVIPVEFEFTEIGRALRGLLERGSFDYRVSGMVALEGPIQRDFRYRHAGEVTPSGVR